MRRFFCTRRWLLAKLLWLVSAACFLVAPALAIPLRVEGIEVSWGQLALLLGLAMAWGDTRRKVEDLRDEVKRLPCRSGECSVGTKKR